jgi:putative transposase
VQPLAPYEHLHVDVSYTNLSRILFFLCSLLEGCSRSIVHWELREAMTQADVEIILQRGLEKYPHTKASNHVRQRTAVLCSRFQKVHP